MTAGGLDGDITKKLVHAQTAGQDTKRKLTGTAAQPWCSQEHSFTKLKCYSLLVLVSGCFPIKILICVIDRNINISLHKTSKTKSMKLNIVSIRAAIQTLGTPTTEGHARDQSQGGVLK